MAGTLDRLKELLGEPNSWGWARPRLGEAAEEHLDIRLPADYKAFLDLYGPGAFDGFLWMDRPVDGTAHELERLWPRSGGKCDLHLTDPGRYPFPFHPRPGGLIEWSGEEDGTVYYFLPEEPEPADWRVVVETGEGEWHEVPGPFTEFLLGIVEGPHRPAFLGRYRPGPDIRYHQTPTL
ncbi:SMI1/KNR4 family protein [Streptomyces virginiae]|uniref:SMI1/KNR4 family protein n=1 Tax=Streptomyces virginiae TaxID=1961 RepID=UPI0022529192|nr:SMI1/KNR4 family protein [Streptomyces virginiae]MCX4960205.1 SMI1/KNR4 family protein [Streptomyces virginiae]